MAEMANRGTSMVRLPANSSPFFRKLPEMRTGPALKEMSSPSRPKSNPPFSLRGKPTRAAMNWNPDHLAADALLVVELHVEHAGAAVGERAQVADRDRELVLLLGGQASLRLRLFGFGRGHDLPVVFAHNLFQPRDDFA